MLKKVMCYLFALALLVSMAMMPVNAESEVLVFDKDYGNATFKGSSKAEGELPIPSDYAGNLTIELYVKINDFNTPTVIAGAWGALAGYALWCNSGELYFSCADTNGNNKVSFPSSVTADWEGKWLHLIGVKEGATNILYCNVEGSDRYEEESSSRSTDRVYTDASEFIINGADTDFEGAGDFVLGTVRVYNANVSDNFDDMRAECEERLAQAGSEQPPAEDNDGNNSNEEQNEDPSANPSDESNGNNSGSSNDTTDNSSTNNGTTNNNGSSNGSTTNNGTKVTNTTTFDLGIVSLAAVALSSMVAVKKRK